MAYFSNGSEGMVFDDQCAKCKYGKMPCPIAFIQVDSNYDQIGNELATKIMTQLVSNDGTCQMWLMCRKDFEINPNQLELTF